VTLPTLALMHLAPTRVSACSP